MSTWVEEERGGAGDLSKSYNSRPREDVHDVTQDSEANWERQSAREPCVLHVSNVGTRS